MILGVKFELSTGRGGRGEVWLFLDYLLIFYLQACVWMEIGTKISDNFIYVQACQDGSLWAALKHFPAQIHSFWPSFRFTYLGL